MFSMKRILWTATAAALFCCLLALLAMSPLGTGCPPDCIMLSHSLYFGFWLIRYSQGRLTPCTSRAKLTLHECRSKVTNYGSLMILPGALWRSAGRGARIIAGTRSVSCWAKSAWTERSCHRDLHIRLFQNRARSQWVQSSEISIETCMTLSRFRVRDRPLVTVVSG